MTAPAALRDHGHQLALAVDQQDNDVIEQAVASIGRARGYVTSADIHDLLPILASSNAIGGVMRGMAVRGLLRDTGRTVKAQHAAGRCRRVVVWAWTGGAA